MAGSTNSLSAGELKSQLESLTSKIDTTMREVATIRHPMMEDDRIQAAVDELAAIVAATELATGEILDKAEQLEAVAEESGDEMVEERIVEIVTSVYEACNFQDITGQRINKVMQLLREIDDRLMTIIESIGEQEFASVPPPAKAEGDAALLNGPARPNGGMAQDTIDSLFP